MSQFRKWITGAEAMKLLNISRLDLIELVKDRKLQAHDHLTGEPVEIMNRPAGFLFGDDFGSVSIKHAPGGGYTFGPALISPKGVESCAFLITEMESLRKTQLKKRRNEDKWDMVRKEAIKKWESNPHITIHDMALSDEIIEILGSKYAEKTIRKHIKDLCPNRSQGRRPVPSKK
jgi:hypothetical protein